MITHSRLGWNSITQLSKATLELSYPTGSIYAIIFQTSMWTQCYLVNGVF